jgi:hypothetical protein
MAGALKRAAHAVASRAKLSARRRWRQARSSSARGRGAQGAAQSPKGCGRDVAVVAAAVPMPLPPSSPPPAASPTPPGSPPSGRCPRKARQRGALRALPISRSRPKARWSSGLLDTHHKRMLACDTCCRYVALYLLIAIFFSIYACFFGINISTIYRDICLASAT